MSSPFDTVRLADRLQETREDEGCETQRLIVKDYNGIVIAFGIGHLSYVKHLLDRIQARGADFITDRYVCSGCVTDKALRRFIRRDASEWRECSYCNKRRPVLDVDDLVDVIMDGIRTEYDDPANCMGWIGSEGGWIGTTIDKYDLVSDLEITDNQLLMDDIIEAITNFEWCEQDPYGLSRDERLANGWERFCERVKHENHFFPTAKPRRHPRFKDPDEVEPTELLQSLERIFVELDLVRQLHVGTRIVRARPHDAGKTLSTARDLGPPPKERAVMPNRMSPAGVPMFYGAFDSKTALAEVDYPVSGRAATVATFETLTPLKVVDLTRIPPVPSLFDLDRNYLRPWTRFIRDFVEDFSKPISRDTAEHVEYVPTQYVTAYIQNRMRGNITGVVFPSSKKAGGKSCVLFIPNRECRPDGEGYPKPVQRLSLLPTSIRRYPALPK